MDFILHKEPISCTAGQDQELLQVGSAVLEIRETWMSGINSEQNVVLI